MRALLEKDLEKFMKGEVAILNDVMTPIAQLEDDAEPYEVLASFAANVLVDIRQALKEGCVHPGKRVWDDISRKLEKLREINKFLENHLLSASSDSSPDLDSTGRITNPYIQYYLTQVSGFNGLLNQVVGIRDCRKEASRLLESYQETALEQFDIIKSVFTLDSAPKNMGVDLHRDSARFRPPYVYEQSQTGQKGLRYYYDQKTTPDGRSHQDYSLYLKANPLIGLATQTSNMASSMKEAGKKLCGLSNRGQREDDYFKGAHVKGHAEAQALFRSAQQKIKDGKTLTSAEKIIVDGQNPYYCLQSPMPFYLPKPTEKKEASIVHIGHASAFINVGGLSIVADPLHEHTGTDPDILGLDTAGKRAYPRQTDPAFSIEGYPKTDVVIISHNHHDHMCCRSLEKIFKGNPGTVFIVPVGDAGHMHRFGLKNVIEFESWNDYAEIDLMSNGGAHSSYRISSFPAKHASNRKPKDDLYQSLYMGYMIQDLSKKELILLTGDTAVLDDEHFAQLQKYLIDHDLTISMAEIAHGPDRPRSLMEMTHQSTADAVAMHARLMVMNARVIKARKEKAGEPVIALNLNDLKEKACYGLGYHHGCYRLGLLSYNDVDSTLTRMLAVLEDCKKRLLDDFTNEFLENNMHYALLDPFEKAGLIDTLKAYQVSGVQMTAGDVKDLMCTYLKVPQPGYRADLNQKDPHDGFKFDYSRLLVNSNPGNSSIDRPYEYFAYHLSKDFVENIDNNLRDFIVHAFTQYVTHGGSHKSSVKRFLNNLNVLDNKDLKNKLIEFYNQEFPQGVRVDGSARDEKIRDEGHLSTLFTIVSGLISDVGGFRKCFLEKKRAVVESIDRSREEVSARSFFAKKKSPPYSGGGAGPSCQPGGSS